MNVSGVIYFSSRAKEAFKRFSSELSQAARLAISTWRSKNTVVIIFLNPKNANACVRRGLIQHKELHPVLGPLLFILYISIWNQRKLKALIPRVVVFAKYLPSAERRIIVLWCYGRKICLNMCYGNSENSDGCSYVSSQDKLYLRN